MGQRSIPSDRGQNRRPAGTRRGLASPPHKPLCLLPNPPIGPVASLSRTDGRVFSNGTPKNLYHLALLFEWSDIGGPGLLGVAEPFFRLLARRARRKGIDKKLEAEYCR